MIQFNQQDNETITKILELLIQLGSSELEAYKTINNILKKYGWEFVCFNNTKEFWITTNELN